MELRTFDILLLFVLAVSASLVIGFNVINLIDNKLGNMKINVPPCPVPNIYIDNQDGSIRKITYTKNKNLEGFDNISKSNENLNKQFYESVRDSSTPLVLTDIGDSKTLLLRRSYELEGAKLNTTSDDIMYPSADNIVRYNDNGCYKGYDNSNITRVIPKRIVPSQCKAVNYDTMNKFRINTISPAGQLAEQNVSLYTPTVYMGETPPIKGTAYANMTLEIPADVDQIGSIPVNDYEGDPIPLGSFINF